MFNNLLGIQVITSEHMTETIEKKIIRRFSKPRKGANKSPVKIFHRPPVIVPSNEVLFMNGNRTAVMHPTLWYRLQNDPTFQKINPQ